MGPPERFSNLPDYAFPRLRKLLAELAPPAGVVPQRLTIGEPRHDMPDFVDEVLAAHLHEFALYPPNEGAPELLEAISAWIDRRFRVSYSHDRIVTLNGTREGLFNAALALAPERKNGARPAILIPNPFYQVYAVAAAAVAAEPIFVPATDATGHLPDYAALPPAILERTAIAYICSPANPQGTVASEAWLEELLDLAERHDFLVFADECYSEIWRDAPPPGALTVADAMGLGHRVVAFNSLSKRSNLPGLRVGFAAGPVREIAEMRRLRSYAGAPIPLPLQRVAAAAFRDEAHVDASRARYQAKYAIADRILGNVPGYLPPQGGFFLWLPVPPHFEGGEDAARHLWQAAGLQVLPGAYLARTSDGSNPGARHIRVALVASESETETALTALHHHLYEG